MNAGQTLLLILICGALSLPVASLYVRSLTRRMEKLEAQLELAENAKRMWISQAKYSHERVEALQKLLQSLAPQKFSTDRAGDGDYPFIVERLFSEDAYKPMFSDDCGPPPQYETTQLDIFCVKLSNQNNQLLFELKSSKSGACFAADPRLLNELELFDWLRDVVASRLIALLSEAHRQGPDIAKSVSSSPCARARGTQ